MGKVINTRKKAIISFLIFAASIIKYVLVNVMEVIPPYGSMNRSISWTIMLPLMIIGIVLSILVISGNIRSRKVNLIDIALSLPILLFTIYFFLIK